MGHLEVLEYLLAFCKPLRGWHGNRGYHKLDINAVNSDNKTVLQIAAEKGRYLYPCKQSLGDI